jgi:O-antigen/teichoic acid export membrane protein
MTTETPIITASEARRAARNAGAIAAASLLSRGLQFGWQLIFIATLSPAVYGIYGAVSSFVQIGATIAGFGVGPIVIRDVARHPNQAGKYLTATLFIQTPLALAAYVLLNIAAGLGGYGEAVRVFLAVAALNLMIDALGNMCFDLLLAREQMVTTSLVSIAYVIALIALAAIGLFSGYSLFGVYTGVMVAGILRTGALWWLAWLAHIRPLWPLDQRLAGALLLNSAPLAISAFLSLAYQQADKLLTSRFIGDRETGWLAAAFIIFFGVVELLNTTIITALYPLMSRAHGDGKQELFGFLVEKLSFFTLVICLPLTLTLSIFSGAIFVPIFGVRYQPTAAILSLLIWYALVMMTGNAVQQAMLVQNRQRRVMLARATGLLLNLALLFLFLPRFGVMGAPLASLVAESAVFALYWSGFRAAGWQPAQMLPRLGRLLVVGLGSGIVMLALPDW